MTENKDQDKGTFPEALLLSTMFVIALMFGLLGFGGILIGGVRLYNAPDLIGCGMVLGGIVALSVGLAIIIYYQQDEDTKCPHCGKEISPYETSTAAKMQAVGII